MSTIQSNINLINPKEPQESEIIRNKNTFSDENYGIYHFDPRVTSFVVLNVNVHGTVVRLLGLQLMT